MKEIQEKYQPIEDSLLQDLNALITQRKYISIHYFTDIREYIYTRGIIKQIIHRDTGDFILLTTGEEVRLDRIVRFNGTLAPGYDIMDFTCDC